jgi:predicted RNase H-like HicB family nuclease
MAQQVVTYSIIPERSHDGSWWAIAPDLPGLLMYGETRDELLASAPDAIADYLEAMREDDQPVPAPGTYEIALSAAQEQPVPIAVPAA